MAITTDFSGKVALVVGATAGIGRATALAFAQAGAKVMIAGLGEAQGQGVLRELQDAGCKDAAFLETDVAREAAVKALVEATLARFGRLDIAINNAGTEGRFGPIQDMSVEEFDRIVTVNLRGVWLGMKYEIPALIAAGGGAIVNTTSSAGLVAIPNVGVYSASKHGVVGLTRAAALELARAKVRVNAVAPGPVDTGLLSRMVAGHVEISTIAEGVPMGRISQPEEIARTILFLCSDAASYITGHVLAVDGGVTVT